MNSRRMYGLLAAAFKNWQEDNCLRLSAALAYYSIFSIAPLLVICASMAGLFLGREAARNEIHQQLQDYIGSQAAGGVQSMVRSASQPQQSIIGAIVGVATLLIGAAGVFAQLKDSLNLIWKVKLKPGGGIRTFLRDYLLSFGMVLVIGFLLLVSLVLTTIVSGISGWMGRLWTLPAGVWGGVTFCLSYGFVVAMFGAIFKVLPDAQVKWKQVWIGAALTGILFEIGKFALGWYLGRPSTVSTYGAASSVVLVLLWVYYASIILFFGAEFTRVYAEANGVAIRPSEYAVKTDLTPAVAAAPVGPALGAGDDGPLHGA